MTTEELYKKFLERELLWDARFKKLEKDLHGKHSLQVEKINSLERLLFGVKVGK